MCAIIGAALDQSSRRSHKAQDYLNEVWFRSHERGRDGRGYCRITTSGAMVGHASVQRRIAERSIDVYPVLAESGFQTIVGNLRAEPTTEFVRDKKLSDQQPYQAGEWAVVHNGTIANDKELRTHHVPTTIDSAAIAELLVGVRGFSSFVAAIKRLKGSYAILAAHHEEPGLMYVAANYRPVWYVQTPSGVFFASARDYFPGTESAPQMLLPYTAALFSPTGIVQQCSLYTQQSTGQQALVVCSGGLDSVVSATYAKEVMKADVHLIHFKYGSRAEGPEVEAVRAVAKHLGCELTIMPLPVYSKGDSPLLDPDSAVAGGEAGAEFAHEWVPARNLLLLSVATAFAEAKGIDTIVLGNNLEEAGAYPDNEPEFIARFNDLLPFAVGDGKRMRVLMPVGNMMKHEIVALGESLDAPMHLTWSCYRAGKLHCGKCGPCFMRRKAFEINDLNEVISYEDNK